MAKVVLMSSPRIWVLLDDRPGHHTQVLGLADALGWDYETRALVFNRLNQVPNGLLGASAVTLNKALSDPLESPFPDLVIAMGRRCIPVARWIRQVSGQSTALVQLGRKGLVAPQDFALQIGCAHFNLPPHPQRVAVALPPTQVTAQRLSAAKEEWPDLMKGAASPHVVLLVGGETAHHRFSSDQAADIARRAEAAAGSLDASLTVVTSRRTSQAAISAMTDAAPGAKLHLWAPGQALNPYLGYLAWADVLIVTGESESMLAEAAAAARPLFIAPLEPKPLTVKGKLARWMTREAAGQGPLAASCRRLFNSGWMTPFRELEKMHQVMYGAGLAKPFESDLSLAPPENYDALEQVSTRLHSLLERRGAGS